jgi:hypothetical protein
VSGRVVLRPPLPGVVVTWFVTSSDLPPLWVVQSGSQSARLATGLCAYS